MMHWYFDAFHRRFGNDRKRCDQLLLEQVESEIDIDFGEDDLVTTFSL
jgi:hypothetical protein